MTVGMIVALVLLIPVILFPAAFVWYLNVAGVMVALKEAKEKRATQQKATVKA